MLYTHIDDVIIQNGSTHVLASTYLTGASRPRSMNVCDFDVRFFPENSTNVPFVFVSTFSWLTATPVRGFQISGVHKHYLPTQRPVYNCYF